VSEGVRYSFRSYSRKSLSAKGFQGQPSEDKSGCASSESAWAKAPPTKTIRRLHRFPRFRGYPICAHRRNLRIDHSSYHYLSKSGFLAKIFEGIQHKLWKAKEFCLARRRRDAEVLRPIRRCFSLRALISVAAERSEAALGPFVPFVVKLLSVASP